MRIGIDLGGTKMEGIALAASGDELARQRVATPRDSYEGLLASLASMVAALETATGRSGSIGVGTPGVRTPSGGLIVNSNLTLLNGRNIVADLTQHLGRPVRVDNDANCFVLSEASDGAASLGGQPRGDGPDVVFGATLGTGVGGGIVVDGRVLAGANGMAAEWSHTTLPFLRPDDIGRPGCFCGHEACIESFISGPGLEHDFVRETGHALPGRAIVARAESGDPDASGALARYEDRLARALAGVINLIDPRAIVLGGGLSDIPSLYRNVLPLCERYTVAKGLRTKLVRAKHGDASGARGAAWLWPEA
jgi:fructokinase